MPLFGSISYAAVGLFYAIVCVLLGGLSYATLWVLFGIQRRLSALLLLESAIAVPVAGVTPVVVEWYTR